jgi:ABC-2 type transport system permease protein
MTTSFVFLMPLTFASDIFVKLSTMPGWLQAFVSRNPVTHLASASRKLMHGEPALADVTRVMVAAAAIVLVASPIAMRLYRKER